MNILNHVALYYLFVKSDLKLLRFVILVFYDTTVKALFHESTEQEGMFIVVVSILVFNFF